MRPERVRHFPLPPRVSIPERVPQAANDNEPEIRESAASLLLGRSLMVTAVLATIALLIAWGAWIGSTIWRSFF
ncbi:hypothetical protein [Bosea sp. BH3]|uniref:hypothetical protein n=1 Tax=Bosea sp. BH3 TaxID=2871701 RepID=UPI0021CB679C|nr:hypothetical protein [Bosea sp. BH3]MCU4182559.1 hypothetical protein [Bosea sp. BH3]